MPDFSERPDLEFLDSHQAYLEDIWRSSRANWADTDLFRQLDYSIWTGPNAGTHAATRGQYRPPTARTIIDHTADQFTALIPTIRREPTSSDSDAQRISADRLEVAAKTILMDSALHSMVNPWRLLGKHFNSYGYGIIELDLDFKGERGRPAYWNPVRINATNPGRVLIDPLEKRPNAAIQTLKMTAVRVAELMAEKRRLKYRGSFDMTNRNPWDMVTLTKHWTNEWLTLREEGGEILYQQRNAWGFVPFAHAFAGYGMEPVSLNENDPRHMAQGLLDPIKGALRIQAQSQTAKHTMVIEQAYAPFVSRLPEELQRALETGAIAVGELADFGKMELQDVPRWVFESGRETDEMIERSVGASARGGLRQPGVDTVGQQAILNTEMRRKFIGPSIQQEHMASIVTGWILKLVDNLSTLKDGIGAHGKRLSRSDISGNYDINVTFEVMDPVMEMQRRSMFLQEWQLGLLDDEGYWTATGVQNITQRREALNRQRVRNSPEVVARTARITAEAMDELDAEDVEAITAEAGGGAGAAGGALPMMGTNGGGPAAPPMRQPLDEQTPKPERIDLDRFV